MTTFVYGLTYQSRITQPRSITSDRLQICYVSEGQFRREKALKMLGLSGDKVEGNLTLANPYLRVTTIAGAMMVVSNPTDPLCPVKIYELYTLRFHRLGYQGPFFLHPVSNKEWTLRQSREGARAVCGNEKCPVGTNFFNEIYKRIAHKCDFVDKESYTSRSGRRTKISVLNQKNVDANYVNAESRHAHTATNQLYRHQNVENNDKLLAAKMFGEHPKLKVRSCRTLASIPHSY